MRYLIYYVSKQDQPWFTDSIEGYAEDTDCTVVVDLETGNRLWCGEWKPCAVSKDGKWVEREDT